MLVIDEEDIQFPASQDTLIPQQTQLANDYKKYNHSAGASYGWASRTVVTAWPKSNRVLIPSGFLISGWLDNLLSITNDFQC